MWISFYCPIGISAKLDVEICLGLAASLPTGAFSFQSEHTHSASVWPLVEGMFLIAVSLDRWWWWGGGLEQDSDMKMNKGKSQFHMMITCDIVSHVKSVWWIRVQSSCLHWQSLASPLSSVSVSRLDLPLFAGEATSVVFILCITHTAQMSSLVGVHTFMQ